ncbi:NAD-dependent epimerase/dehydratase family protein [Geodermatophilus sp. SYSU D00684]
MTEPIRSGRTPPRRAVVTGGAGFIGSHLADALVRAGEAVLVVDDLSTGRPESLQDVLAAGADVARLDLRDGAALEETFVRFRPDVVFHLAAQMDVRVSMVETARDAEINVVGSINVFTAAAARGVTRVVNTSTGGAIYGEAAVVPTPETGPTVPLSAYGLSKRTGELYPDWYRRVKDLDVISLRYGNVYGPRQDPSGDAGVVFCARLLEGRSPIVFGDGEQTRDHVYVDDIVAANVAAAQARDLRHAVYNIGTGREISVLQLIEAVAVAAGKDPATLVPGDAAGPAGGGPAELPGGHPSSERAGPPRADVPRRRLATHARLDDQLGPGGVAVQ